MFTLRDIHDMDEAVSGKSNNNYVLYASKLDIRALQRDLEQIEDPRGGQGRRYRFLPLFRQGQREVAREEQERGAEWKEKVP